jgi:hypothetical protein
MRLKRGAAQKLLDFIEVLRRQRSARSGRPSRWRDHLVIGWGRRCRSFVLVTPDVAAWAGHVVGGVLPSEVAERDEPENPRKSQCDEERAENRAP